jgi:RNA polymerase sigma-70 factor (ECF subfamily)
MADPRRPHEDSAGEKLELLFAAHHEAVARYLRRRTRPELVDDAVAETFLVACRRPGAIPAEPLPWLLGVARRVLSTQHRSGRRQAALATKLAAIHSWQPVSSDDADVLDRGVHESLMQLSEPDREALTLIAWDGLTPAQAAVVLSISPVAFRARLSRARKRVSSALRSEPTSVEEPLQPHPAQRKEAIR